MCPTVHVSATDSCKSHSYLSNSNSLVCVCIGSSILHCSSFLVPQTVVKKHPVVGNTTKPKPGKPKPSYTSITDEEEKKEFFDTPEEAEKKVKQIAEYMRNSRYTVMFTGAGISTR